MARDLSGALVYGTLMLLLLLGGCATYDRPTIVKSPQASVDDLVRYRQLTRDDFRAASPPEGITGVSVAVLCTQIVLVPSARVHVRSIQAAAGRQQHEATLVDLGFYAVVNRACSWWNPNAAGVKKDEEILEHEQVHFALTELVARDLNRRAGQITHEFRAVGNTPAEAIAGIRGDFVVRVRQDFLKRDEKFDEEMSGLLASSARQKEWLRQVESELRDTQVYAQGPFPEVEFAQVNKILPRQGNTSTRRLHSMTSSDYLTMAYRSQ